MAFSFKNLNHFFSVCSLKHIKSFSTTNLSNNLSRIRGAPQHSGFLLLAQKPDLDNKIIIFHMEKTLLKSSSLFPYFMLVAFEAGSLLRALILFILYPFMSLSNEDFTLRVMVLVCFLGLKKGKFREGRAVLPKFFLQDVGMESFEVLKRGSKTVAVSNLPQIMVESFLMEYLDIDFVYGRELKVFCGYYVGLMEKQRDDNKFEDVGLSPVFIGVRGCNNYVDCQWFSNCKEVYMVSELERRNWHELPRHLYPKPLVFHDGRLAFRPTFFASVAMFMWIPMGFMLSIIRLTIALSLPYEISTPILHFFGNGIRIYKPKNFDPPSRTKENSSKGVLYVSNHRTLIDPLLLSYSLRGPLTAVTYSVSRMSEITAPIKTVRLTRNRDRDSKLMLNLLSEGDVVIFPEGTTCREPYLLRFSPLFTEVSEKILPVAMESFVGMFYGTTAGGLKSLDPLFFFMNPSTSYSVRFMDIIHSDCMNKSVDFEESLKFKMANSVQKKIADELGFSCTKLTRKDKYLVLAGNEGTVGDGN